MTATTVVVSQAAIAEVEFVAENVGIMTEEFEFNMSMAEGTNVMATVNYLDGSPIDSFYLTGRC